MGDQFKCDSSGTCNSCKEVVMAEENLECFFCKGVYHGSCSNMAQEEKPGTKSLVTHFNRPSTQKNFKFFCNTCLTKFEIDLASNDTRRLNKVEDNISDIKTELEDIKKLLKENGKPLPPARRANDDGASGVDNIWFDKSRLESTKIAPAQPMLLLNNEEIVNNTVEKAIIEKGIPVTNSYTNKSGKLVVVCENVESRDELQRIIASSNENVEMKSITKKKPSITIVGLSRNYSKEEIINQLVSQNHFIRQFTTVNDINEHIEIHDVKPTRAKPSIFQAFASVSDTLRKGFYNYKDKVTVGLTSCKIYDRYHVKRCNNCQGIGHYYKECPTPDETRCAKCSLDHPTNSCTAVESKCINCCKEGRESNHKAYDPKCPALVSEIEKKKTLNSQRIPMVHR